MNGKADPPKPTTLKAELISWAKAIGVALAVWIVLRSYLIEAFRIPSESMENTLLVGDFLFVDKTGFGGQFEIPFTGIRFLRLPGYATPRRDHVVIFRSVEDSTPNLSVVKRIIGQGGDTLQMMADTVYRNGQKLIEPHAIYIATHPEDALRLREMRDRQLPHYVGPAPERYRPTTHDWGPIVVPADHYFMMGDNRNASYDSRYWGFLPKAHIVGRPIFLYFSVATNPFRVRWNRLLRHPA